jgi:hypothetical protein
MNMCKACGRRGCTYLNENGLARNENETYHEFNERNGGCDCGMTIEEIREKYYTPPLPKSD